MFSPIKDGDYNKDINEMYEAKKANKNNTNSSNTNVSYKSTNCLCERCNFYQQLKIEKLSKFEPKKEVHIYFLKLLLTFLYKLLKLKNEIVYLGKL